MKGLKIPKKKGEKTRKKLLRRNKLNQDYKIVRKNEYLILPLKNNQKKYDLKKYGKIVEFQPEKVQKTPKNYKEVLKKSSDPKIPKKLWNKLPSSYDLIGNIAIIDIPEELNEYKETIAKALIKAHENIKTVLDQKSPVSGRYRVRDLEQLAGKNKTETLYKEHGIELKMDLQKVYFTPRLSTERKRITNTMKNVKNVIDMFAGVGPFSIMIAKNSSKINGPKKIDSIEINPEAYKYLNENIKRNNVQNIIQAHKGNAKKIIKKLKPTDRIIMNLPSKGEQFLQPAIKKTKPGGIIHFYTFTKNLEKTKTELKNKKPKNSNLEIEFVNQRKVRSYSKEIDNIVLDIKVDSK